MAVILPSVSETNVSETDGAPGEESGKTGKSEKPIEDDGSLGAQVYESKKTEGDDEDGGPERTTGLIDVAEQSWSITLLGQGRQGTRATVDARYADRDDGYENDDV